MNSGLLNEIISWLPMAVILGIWLFFMRHHFGKSRTNTNEIMDMNREIVSLAREQNALSKTMSGTLVQIQKLMEDRKS